MSLLTNGEEDDVEMRRVRFNLQPEVHRTNRSHYPTFDAETFNERILRQRRVSMQIFEQALKASCGGTILVKYAVRAVRQFGQTYGQTEQWIAMGQMLQILLLEHFFNILLYNQPSQITMPMFKEALKHTFCLLVRTYQEAALYPIQILLSLHSAISNPEFKRRILQSKLQRYNINNIYHHLKYLSEQMNTGTR